MRITVSVPDGVFQAAEHLAKRLAKSRSQLYSEALVEYVRRHDANAVASRLDEACDALGPTKDRFVTQTARKILGRVNW